jgi:hypothetical protein
VTALGAQRRVDLVGASHGRRGVEQLEQAGEDLPRLLRGAHTVLVGLGVDRLVDEHDVDVGDVVELLAAELAHPDHGDPGGRLVARDLLVHAAQRAGQHRLGQPGELRPDLGDVGHAGEVAGGDVGGDRPADGGDAGRLGGRRRRPR